MDPSICGVVGRCMVWGTRVGFGHPASVSRFGQKDVAQGWTYDVMWGTRVGFKSAPGALRVGKYGDQDQYKTRFVSLLVS